MSGTQLDLACLPFEARVIAVSQTSVAAGSSRWWTDINNLHAELKILSRLYKCLALDSVI